MSDYEEWKQWFEKWNIQYQEQEYWNGDKSLIVADMSVDFDKNDKLLYLTNLL